MGAKVLIVDDDELMRSSLAFNLTQAGYEARTAATAEDADSSQKRPDIILLDIMLPGMDGLEALRYFRDKAGLPVIFLTARRREFDQVLGLELGADDYLTKPFDPEVLVAHIRAVLRRTRPAPAPPAEQKSQMLQVGELMIDLRSRTCTMADHPVELTPKEFDLLYAMALEPGKVLTIDELLTRVWGAEYSGEPQIVYVNMRWLRQKIEKDPQHPQYLLTVRSVGYKLVDPSGGPE